MCVKYDGTSDDERTTWSTENCNTKLSGICASSVAHKNLFHCKKCDDVDAASVRIFRDLNIPIWVYIIEYSLASQSNQENKLILY